MAQQHKIDVATSAIDAYLAAPTERRLSGAEFARAIREALSPVVQPPDRDRLPKNEDQAQRVMVCWRLARVMAQVAGLCTEDESLDEATEVEDQSLSPWTHPTVPTVGRAAQAQIRRGMATVAYSYYREGLPLLPPSEPGDVAERWCKLAALIARELRIAGTDDGERGLEGLLDPRTAPYANVTEANVLALEELLVDEAGKLLIECGERAAIEHFRARYGFARKEAVGLVRLARADALVTGASSVEEDRAIMVANLKDLAARAKEEMNSERELRALRELARVQGLTRSEPEDLARTFSDVIARVGRQQDQKVIEAQARVLQIGAGSRSENSVWNPPARPDPEAADLDADEDLELEREYDRENR